MLRLLVASALLAACGQTPAADAPAPPAVRSAAGPPAVLAELFTSEGCSSCPPADRLLARLHAARETTGVVALAYHVDYWDRLGWRDPYASAAFTARQRAYARTLDGRVYTPQLVVGGTAGFVGSRPGAARDALREAAAPSVRVAVAARADGAAAEVAYAVDGAPDGARLHVALVQPEASTRVARGENGGRTLRHVRVVRALETVPAGRGTVRVGVPPSLAGDRLRVVAFVQPGEVGAVLGVAETALARVSAPGAPRGRPRPGP